MPFRSEYEAWAAEREAVAKGARPTPLGHVIAALVGVLLAVLVVAFERGVIG
jgi:hypothetical protein